MSFVAYGVAAVALAGGLAYKNHAEKKAAGEANRARRKMEAEERRFAETEQSRQHGIAADISGLLGNAEGNGSTASASTVITGNEGVPVPKNNLGSKAKLG